MKAIPQPQNRQNDAVGKLGEKIAYIRLTDYKNFSEPLFDASFLGEKWPTIDFYAVLLAAIGSTPYFFGQVKATTKGLPASAQSVRISVNKNDVECLLGLPGPTYIFGVHVPSERVFIRSVHSGIMPKAIGSIPVSHELTPANLRALYDEVSGFWKSRDCKPYGSVFA